jgi:hypothetical protein
MTEHSKLLPRILEKMFPDNDERETVLEILQQYGHAEFQKEPDRVGMAILKLSGRSPERVRYYTLMACRDYRDVISAAEYPNQIGKYKLREEDPDLYERIVLEDKDQYQEWYLGVLWNGKPGSES